MNIIEIIQDLKEYCTSNTKEDKTIFKSSQNTFMEGFIGVMLNECNESNNYEVYLYVKDKDLIASPLLLEKYKNVIDATNYYEELVDFIKNNTPESIVNRCKNTILKSPPKSTPKFTPKSTLE